MIKKVTVRESHKSLAEFGKWQGYIVANNVNRHHVNTGYAFGCWIEVKSLAELEQAVESYIYYNSEPEIWNGHKYPHYYMRVQDIEALKSA